MGKIVLAFSKDDTADKLRQILNGSGHEITAVCHSCAEVLRVASELDEILVIMGYKLPDAVADEVAEGLRDGQKIISLMRAERRDLINNDDILTVTLPVNRHELLSAIDIIWGEIERVRHRAKRTDEEKEIIEKAKLFLMETYQMSEERAHRFIQKRSMDSGERLADVARTVLNI